MFPFIPSGNTQHKHLNPMPQALKEWSLPTHKATGISCSWTSQFVLSHSSYLLIAFVLKPIRLICTILSTTLLSSSGYLSKLKRKKKHKINEFKGLTFSQRYSWNNQTAVGNSYYYLCLEKQTDFLLQQHCIATVKLTTLARLEFLF